MKAYIIKKNRKIEPFGDNVSNCLIGNKELTKWQQEILSERGIEPYFVLNEDEIKNKEECICFSDNLYFTLSLLDEFISKARKENKNTVCVLKKGITTLRTGTNLQEVTDYKDSIGYDLRYYPNGNSVTNHSRILINPDEFNASLSVPFHMCNCKKGYAVPITNKFMVQIDHWVNLWSANILTALANIARIRNMPKLKLLPWKLFQNLNKIGNNCKIHRSALVEANIIGDNVTVEAGAIVRASIIGDNVHIGNGVIVEESVVGPNSSILSGHLLYCVFYPNTFSVTGMVSASLIGRDSFLGVNTTLTDFRFDGKNVLVLKNNEKIDSGNLFLGACLGHEVYLGSGSIIAPGRVVPNGLRLTLPKDGVFSKDSNEEKNVRIVNHNNKAVL